METISGEPSLSGHLGSVEAIVSAAVQLGAQEVAGWSARERALVSSVPHVALPLRTISAAIAGGLDPLGEAYCRVRSGKERRQLGQTYTPPGIIASMLDWAAGAVTPAHVIDPGSGSGRFTVAAGRRFPQARLLAADIDPVATLMTRAAAAAAGMAGRTSVLLCDYRALPASRADGTRLYLGNPPYVRHHQIEPSWKRWLLATAAARGLDATALAGLHAYFFLATAEHGRPGDAGAFITSAEWLDVNYGTLIRQLLLDGLGGQGIHLLDPVVAPFADAATTGVVTTFLIGSRPRSIRFRAVGSAAELGSLDGGKPVAADLLARAPRWTSLIRSGPALPAGWTELGELCRVHRGTATGANQVWVTSAGATSLPPRVLFRSVTRARELFAAGPALECADHLRFVIDLPADLGELGEPGEDARDAVDRFLRQAMRCGVADGYLASHRRSWWRIGLPPPAPILATYMARRPPAFVRNLAGARHLNIAHGLYPREPLPAAVLDALAAALRSCVAVSQGRTYAGGLTKFEPREMERLPVPGLALLNAG